MDAAFFLDLFDYNDWANNRVLNIIAQAENDSIPVPENVYELMSHILGAQEIWMYRLQNRLGGKELFALKPLSELIEINNRSTLEWKSLIQEHSNDFSDFALQYKNIEGQAFSNKLHEVIMHVVNHGTYHRGQISRALKAAGIQPVSTDFIVYSRK